MRLRATPAGLGALTLCRSAVQAACYPLAAYAAVRCDRALVVAAGAFLWAAATSSSPSPTASHSPIFAEIVPERPRTSIYTLDRSFESVFAAFAPLVVGYLAEHAYGYSPVTSGVGMTSVARDRANAAALAKALYAAIAVPMLLCCFIYSLLYQTYPRDREMARMDSLISSELQRIELEFGKISREKRIFPCRRCDIDRC